MRFNSIYLGEIYDARHELPGWNRAGFDDSAWRPAKDATEPVGRLEPQPQPPIRVRESVPAVRVTQSQPGVFIFDLGRNFAGWAGCRLHAPAGTKIVMRYGELLHPDGTLNPLTSVCGQIKGTRKNKVGVPENIGGPGSPEIAWQADTYVARGGGEENYTPRFCGSELRTLCACGRRTLSAIVLLHVEAPTGRWGVRMGFERRSG